MSRGFRDHRRVASVVVVAPHDVRDETRIVVQVLLEPFWPSRRVVQFDEFCRPAA